MIASYKTKYNADSIETRPNQHNTFACATYQLDSEAGERHGNVALLQYCNQSLKETSVLEVGGVLDLWWKSEWCLFAAKASGELQALHVDDNTVTDTSTSTLTVSSVISRVISSVILLAVDGRSDLVVTSDTAGNIYLVDPERFQVSSTLTLVHGAQGWGAEVWGLALDKHDADLVYSGGDDCLLRCHDMRTTQPVFTSKYHEMGVCCISPDPLSPNQIISGSYDESLVLWDTRKMRQPLESVSVGGGVWRIKRSPTNQHALVAGMHSGFHIIDLNTFKATQTYTSHESLAYGADWMEGGNVATCSFYDNLVNVWHSGAGLSNSTLDGV